MIDTAKAKRLRNRALQLALSEGRVVSNIETKGLLRRVIEYERGRLWIEYIGPRHMGAPQIKPARPTANTILIRYGGAKVLSVKWDDRRTAVPIFKPGSWENLLTG